MRMVAVVDAESEARSFATFQRLPLRAPGRVVAFRGGGKLRREGYRRDGE